MANTVPPLVVDDTSPTVIYSPFSDTLSTPNFTAGWDQLFNLTSLGGAPVQIQNSTSLHVTSLNNASLSLQFQGTGIDLVGYVTNASYTVLVDGTLRAPNSSGFVLASLQNLSNTNHEISLTTVISNTSPNQSFVVFDQAIISAPPTFDSNTTGLTFTPQSLNDSDISFRGFWSFQNDSIYPVHLSVNINDSASANFNGTALQIFGTVSSKGGNYSVQLDNSTAQFSALTSFTLNNTLLFHASALDPNVPHTVSIVNDGGSMILPVGGFRAFSSGDPNLVTGVSPAPNATASAIPGGELAGDKGLAKGTVAALVLAGVLAFLLISGLLFCVFVWRPMKTRQRQIRRERRMMEGAASGGDAVLDIGHLDHSPRSRGSGARSNTHSRKSSGPTGFHRWKQDMEPTNGGKVLSALGLVFRHSGSPKDKDPALDYVEEPGSTKSSSISSRSSQSKSSRGKSRWMGRKKSTPSPSYTIDLPTLSQSREELEEDAPVGHRSFSGLTSLTYMSTPDTENSRELSFNAPSSYLSDASERSPTSPNHARTDSNGLLLIHNDRSGSQDAASVADYQSGINSTRQEPPQVQVLEYELSTNAPSSSSRSRFGTESRRGTSLELDRGSVRTNDDGLSVLGPATARAAIRSLSPRTSELVFTNPSLDRLMNIVRRSDDSKAPRERLLSDETVRPDDPIERARSPYRVVNTKRISVSTSRKSTGLSVRFEDEDDSEEHKGKGRASQTADTLLPPPGRPQGPRAPFRLTPQRPVTSPISEGSFLDLSGSNSNSNSDSSQREPSLASQGMGLKSRWSATTATDPESHNPRQESSDSQGSGGTNSSPSSNFPFPVSLPASPHHPEGFKPSPPVTPAWEAGSRTAPSGQLTVTPHPFPVTSNPASPSDSVPLSISDLHFRHSDSENEELNAHPTSGPTSAFLPPHPPLPSVPPTPTFPPPRISPPAFAPEPLSSPGYIISRVFPHNRSGSGSDQQSPPAHRTFGNS